jgi:hypothetical protein
MKNRCILLTGTIIPNSILTGHQDVELRRKEYFQQIKFYSEALTEPIYFLENSEYNFEQDLEFQHILESSNVHLIKCPISSKYDQGKGFQEFQMLDQAINHLSNRYSSFIKISGRYHYSNIQRLNSISYADCIIDLHYKNKVAVTSLFYSTFQFYQKELKGMFLQVNDSNGVFIEHLCYSKLVNLQDSKIHPFPSTPALQVKNGFDGKWRDTTRPKWKSHFRNIERKLCIWLGMKQIFI